MVITITPYSQRDLRWANVTIGHTKLTIANFGCYLTSLAMVSGYTPQDADTILTEEDGYTEDGLIINERAYTLLGLRWLGKSLVKPKGICIASTDYYAPKFPRHFFVCLTEGQIIDPLDGKIKDNKYAERIVNYRLFDYPT